MPYKIKAFFLNWKTSMPALLAMACVADSEFFKVLPEEYEAVAKSVCTILLALGLLAAKDADKSNSSQPGTTKTLGVVLLMLMVSGCAGTMLDGRVCTLIENTKAPELREEIINSYVGADKREAATRYVHTAGLAASTLCELARAREYERAILHQDNAMGNAPIGGN